MHFIHSKKDPEGDGGTNTDATKPEESTAEVPQKVSAKGNTSPEVSDKADDHSSTNETDASTPGGKSQYSICHETRNQYRKSISASGEGPSDANTDGDSFPYNQRTDSDGQTPTPMPNAPVSTDRPFDRYLNSHQ